VYEVANTPSGLAKTQTTLTTGLGTKLNLAVDSLGNLFVADPDNARVVELSQLGGTFNLLSQQETYLTGLTAPSLVAVDGSDNLYVVDGTKLIEGQPNGTPTTLLSTLSGATGLAVDASGSVYVSSASGTVRIASGTTVLSPFTSTVTDAQGVAIDKSGNVYLVDGTALNLSLVSFNGALNFGSPTLASLSTPPVLDATLMNIGNSALTITGFAGSDAVDFTESGTGCDTSLAPNADCTVAVTMNPGAGIQGPISSTIAIKGNDANAAVVLASGTAPALTANSTTISVDKAATVVSVPITVTVGGTDAAPTGNVVISVDGIAMPAAALTTSGTNGTYTVTIITGISAGSHTFSVAYLGDRTYGTSTGSVTATIAKAATVIIVPNPPPYSLEQNTQNEGTYEPYNTQYFEAAYDTFFKVTVPGASGLLPSGNIAFMQGSSVMCGPATTSTYTTHLSSALAYDPNPPLANQADFNPGCLPISNNSNIPNLLTPQLITSIVYLGDANYLGSTATTTTSGKPILFEELRNPSVAITPTPLTISVTAGTPSAVTPLTVTSVQGYGVSTAPNNYLGAGVGSPLNNYTLPLQFACQGLPVHATCTFSGGNFTDVNGVLHPDWLNLSNDPAQPGTINVTVNTNVSEAATTTSKNSQPAPFEFAAMFGVGLVGLAFGRRSGRKARVLMLICLLIITGAVASMTACSTKILGSVTPTTTTPAGTYSVMVTAQEVGAVSVASSSTSSGFVLVYGSENQMSLPYTMTVTVQ
jgi:hypothetical protein